MKYISEILQFISWPVLIYISYRVSLWAIARYEQIRDPEEA